MDKHVNYSLELCERSNKNLWASLKHLELNEGVTSLASPTRSKNLTSSQPFPYSPYQPLLFPCRLSLSLPILRIIRVFPCSHAHRVQLSSNEFQKYDYVFTRNIDMQETIQTTEQN